MRATRLLTQTENPSWLYPVTMGATTIWERWDSMLPDGTINPGEMTSFNHYALGAIGDWLHRVVAGLAPAAPGYARLRIAPTPLPGFDFACAEHLTPYGRAKAGWRRQGGRVVIEAVVPPNTTATAVLDGAEHEVGSGTHRWEVADPAGGAAPTTVSLDSSLAEIVDDPEAYRLVLDVLAEDKPDAAEKLRKNTVWAGGRELREALSRVAGPPLRRRVADRLAELTASRSGV